MKMCENANINTQSTADYLAQLLKDKKQLVAFPNVFIHVERLLDEEVGKVRSSLFQINGTKKEPLILPEAEGPNTTLSEKVYVPVKEHPDFNFVGRILGPRGMTAKQLELETGCKIMVRGKGSMRDKKKEEQNRGKPNWEHLNDELHVLITVEDTENRAKVKLQRAVEEVKKLLVPADGEDELKKRQLMELAIINGTYRDSSAKAIAGAAFGEVARYPLGEMGICLGPPPKNPSSSQRNMSAFTMYMGPQIRFCPGPYEVSDDDWRRLALVAAAAETQRLLGGPGGGGGGGAMAGMGPPMRPPTAPLGAPLILSPRIPVPTSSATMLNGSGPPHPPPPPPLLSAADAAAAAAGLIYTPYPTAADYANYAALASPLLAEYASAAAADHHAGGAAKQRRHMGQFREHPYQRAGALS